MRDGTPPGSWDDDDDDDYGAPPDVYPDPFDVFLSPADDDADDGWGASDVLLDDDDGEPIRALVFTVTNPPGTVSVTVFLDGRIHQVELAATVTRMTEAELADEVLVIAGLAHQQAQAAQHALLVESMGELGHDRVETGNFLEHDLGLPSPPTVQAETAQVFANRYEADDD